MDWRDREIERLGREVENLGRKLDENDRLQDKARHDSNDRVANVLAALELRVISLELTRAKGAGIIIALSALGGLLGSGLGSWLIARLSR